MSELRATFNTLLFPNPMQSGKLGPLIALLLAILAAFSLYYEGLSFMTRAWKNDEYSHAVMIPFISIFLILQILPTLKVIEPKNTFWGVGFVLLGIMLLFLGELSALFTLIQYGFLCCLIGLFFSVSGSSGIKRYWVPLAYLWFMIPLPTFVQNFLSNELQLLSSAIGVAIVRLFSISVYLEGNVIDLGAMQLQVVDACSGLRYLFPLMSFGFLIAAVSKMPNWQRVLVFFSTVPIAVLMNSFRIGVIGVTVEHWGITAAEGFLHDFEGWIVFVFCLGILFLEILVINKLSRRNTGIFDQLDLSLPSPLFKKDYLNAFGKVTPSYFICLALLVLTIPISSAFKNNQDITVERKSFSELPLYHNSWIGNEGTLEQGVLDNLKTTDYFIGDFNSFKYDLPLNFYMAYYASQKKGATIHSPMSCIPAGGWEIAKLAPQDVAVKQNGEEKLITVKRAIIQKGESRSIVYYWFQQQGRVVSDEFLNRWYVFLDSARRGRSDGALVRVVVPWPSDKKENEIDEQIQGFIADYYPLLPEFIPN